MKPGKLPPMAQAVRAFMTGMDFPPEPEKGPSPNTAYAGVILALLSHAKALRLDATEASVAPSLKQLTDICHCAERTMRRLLTALHKHGIVTRTIRNGHLSSVYVIHKHSRQDKVVLPTKKIRPDKDVLPESTARADNSTAQGGQLGGLGRTTTPRRGDKVVLFRDNSSGENTSGINPLGDTFENVSSGSSTGQPSSGPGTDVDTHDGTGLVLPGTPLASPSDNTHAEVLPAENTTGNLIPPDESFFCPRCNEGNSELMPDHCCTQCLRLMAGGLKAPRTPEEGRLHMILVLEDMDHDERQRFYASDLTCAESDWIRGCGMFFADELKKWEYNARTEELMAESEATNE